MEGTPSTFSGFGEAAKNLSLILKDNIGIVTDPLKSLTTGWAERINKRKDHKLTFELEKLDLIHRAQNRMILEQIRKQENLESIANQSLPLVNNEADLSQLDIDWIHFFANSCENIGDKEIQILWAKILAGEVNNKGSYSRKTLDILKTISKEDCEIIEKVFSVVISVYDTYFIHGSAFGEIPYIHKLPFNVLELQHLEYLGLLIIKSIGLTIEPGKHKFFNHGDEQFVILNRDSKELTIRGIHLTQSGIELLKTLKVKDENFLNILKDEIEHQRTNVFNDSSPLFNVEVILTERIDKEQAQKVLNELSNIG